MMARGAAAIPSSTRLRFLPWIDSARGLGTTTDTSGTGEEISSDIADSDSGRTPRYTYAAVATVSQRDRSYLVGRYVKAR
jgi:hypothetical protein